MIEQTGNMSILFLAENKIIVNEIEKKLKGI
jgi:hypothetical protein